MQWFLHKRFSQISKIGFELGFELGLEIGFELGFSRVWNSVPNIDTNLSLGRQIGETNLRQICRRGDKLGRQIRDKFVPEKVNGDTNLAKFSPWGDKWRRQIRDKFGPVDTIWGHKLKTNCLMEGKLRRQIGNKLDSGETLRTQVGYSIPLVKTNWGNKLDANSPLRIQIASTNWDDLTSNGEDRLKLTLEHISCLRVASFCKNYNTNIDCCTHAKQFRLKFKIVDSFFMQWNIISRLRSNALHTQR